MARFKGTMALMAMLILLLHVLVVASPVDTKALDPRDAFDPVLASRYGVRFGDVITERADKTTTEATKTPTAPTTKSPSATVDSETTTSPKGKAPATKSSDKEPSKSSDSGKKDTSSSHVAPAATSSGKVASKSGAPEKQDTSSSHVAPAAKSSGEGSSKGEGAGKSDVPSDSSKTSSKFDISKIANDETDTSGAVIFKRNPPGWEELEPATNALLEKYETEGRTWFSRIFLLKDTPNPGASWAQLQMRPNDDPNLNINSFEQHVTGRMGADKQSKHWKRELPNTGNVQRLYSVNDWTQQQGAQAALKTIQTSLQNLMVSSKAAWGRKRQVRDLPSPQGPNVCISSRQDQSYNVRLDSGRLSKGQQLAPTNAYFANWYNVVDGVIIVMRTQSVDDVAPNLENDDRPELQHWAELALYNWYMLHQRGRNNMVVPIPPGGWDRFEKGITAAVMMDSMLEWLNWIVIHGISGPEETHSIIKRCLQSRRGSTDLPTSPLKETFNVGHWCFHALLATKGSSGIVWFLGQYRDILGHKILDGVAITSGDTNDPGTANFAFNPTLMWHVVDYTDNEMLKTLKREREYLRKTNHDGSVSYEDVPKAFG